MTNATHHPVRMIEFRITQLRGLWQIQDSKFVHGAKFPNLDHALAYLTTRIPSGYGAEVVVTDMDGATERRPFEREGQQVPGTVWR